MSGIVFEQLQANLGAAVDGDPSALAALENHVATIAKICALLAHKHRLIKTGRWNVDDLTGGWRKVAADSAQLSKGGSNE